MDKTKGTQVAVRVVPSGRSTEHLGAAVAALDEFFQVILTRLDVEEVPKYLRALRSSLPAGDEAEQPSPEVLEFLSGVVEANRDGSQDAAYVAAGVARDFQRRHEALADALPSTEVAQMLQLSRQAVHERYKNGKLFGLPVNEGVRFPAWQFDVEQPDGVLEGLSAVIARLEDSPLSPFGKLFWLTSPKPELDGETPVERMRARNVDDVLGLAAGAGTL